MKWPVTALLAVLALACGGAPVQVATTVAVAPEAPENCYAFSGNVCMTVSHISVACIPESGGVGMNCVGNVQMIIPTLITTGKVSVGVGVTGTDVVLATIENVPETVPGAITAAVPSQKVRGTCIAGVTSRLVEVYDGNYASAKTNGGRPLFVDSVQTLMSCAAVVAAVYRR